MTVTEFVGESSYRKISLSGWSGIIHPEACPEETLRIISRDGILRTQEGYLQPVQSDSKCSVFITRLPFRGERIRAYVKQFHLHPSLNYLIHLICTGRARRALRATLMLEQHGFNAPRPLALMEKRYGPFCTDSILITKDVPDSVQLSERLDQLGADSSKVGLNKKCRLIRKFGRLVGQMHQVGILHGDLRLRNVLVQEQDGSPVFWFIDNERTKRFPVLSPVLARKNLVQLNMKSRVSNADRLRFLKAYAQARGLTAEELKTIARMVVQGMDRRRAQKSVRTSWKKLKKMWKG